MNGRAANALSSSTNAKEMMASAQLFSLAASALSQLAKGNANNQTRISEAGAISSLVGILSAPVAELQANVSECLSNLCELLFVLVTSISTPDLLQGLLHLTEKIQ